MPGALTKIKYNVISSLELWPLRCSELEMIFGNINQVFSCEYATLKEALSVRPSVRLSVGIELESVKTRISVPAHPSATGMAVYPALFFFHSF